MVAATALQELGDVVMSKLSSIVAKIEDADACGAYVLASNAHNSISSGASSAFAFTSFKKDDAFPIAIIALALYAFANSVCAEDACFARYESAIVIATE